MDKGFWMLETPGSFSPSCSASPRYFRMLIVLDDVWKLDLLQSQRKNRNPSTKLWKLKLQGLRNSGSNPLFFAPLPPVWLNTNDPVVGQRFLGSMGSIFHSVKVGAVDHVGTFNQGFSGKWACDPAKFICHTFIFIYIM